MLLKSLNLVITNKCNLKCKHCDIWKSCNKEDIDLKMYLNFLDSKNILDSYLKFGEEFDIAFGGGEPFLHSKFSEIFDKTVSKFPKANYTISTNGWLVQPILDFLEKRKNVFIKLNISLDGPREKHDAIRGKAGSYDKVLELVFKVRRKYPNVLVELKQTIMKDNYNKILETKKIADKLGAQFSTKPIENIYNYTNRNESLDTDVLNFTEYEKGIIKKSLFKLSDEYFYNGDLVNYKYYKDMVYYIFGKFNLKKCNVLNRDLTILENGESFFCLLSNSVGNIGSKINKVNIQKFSCIGCMLKCGYYKDLPLVKGHNFEFPLRCNIEVTSKCNMNCDMCTHKKIMSKNPKDMSIDTFKSIINRDKKISHVSFLGGEPFVNPDLFKMMNFLDDKQITYEVTTNGYLITPETCVKLRNKIGLKNINISIDGNKEYHDKIRIQGSYEKSFAVVESINKFVNLTICSVYRGDNVELLKKMYLEIMKKMGKANLNFKLIYPMQKKPKNTTNLDLVSPCIELELLNDDKQRKDLLEFKNFAKKHNVKLTFDPQILNKDADLFFKFKNENLNFNDAGLECSQMKSLRYSVNGERIFCEFIRNEFATDICKKVLENPLDICRTCCKLTKTNNFNKIIK